MRIRSTLYYAPLVALFLFPRDPDSLLKHAINQSRGDLHLLLSDLYQSVSFP
uniref:Uncharacterized protein n=1 Tax=Picea glauca TaxID=3330 RepID=A0A101LVI5_PICGL|nr:hypothetical protein ABT39_MTgene1943 [Picea glauca]